MWDLTLPTHNIEAHTNTLTQNTLTHKQSHTNSTQQAYHHSPSSHNQNNLAKKRGVEASKQDPGKDNIADFLPTQPIVFWWFIIIWRQKEINQTFPLVFLIIVIIIIILISMISILVTTIAIIIMIIIIIITWYRRRWHQSQIWRFRICTCGGKDIVFAEGGLWRLTLWKYDKKRWEIHLNTKYWDESLSSSSSIISICVHHHC